MYGQVGRVTHNLCIIHMMLYQAFCLSHTFLLCQTAIFSILTSRCNSYRISEIERLHEERVNVARRSFKQQLQDALIRMSEKYKKYYEDKLAGKLKPTASTLERKSKVTALETEVERCQSIIEMLEVGIKMIMAHHIFRGGYHSFQHMGHYVLYASPL